MPSVEYKGEKYEAKDGFLDLGLLEITDISEIKGLDKLKITHLELSSNDITELKGLEGLKDLEILNCGSNNLSDISGLDSLLPLISQTSAAVSLDCTWPSPFGFLLRPLAIISAMLSVWVPMKRWAGFTHGGLSQWWSTHKPSGIAPWRNS